MAPDLHNQVLVELANELTELENQQKQITQRIDKIRNAIQGLLALTEPDFPILPGIEIRSEREEATLLDMVLHALSSAEEPLTPTEIRDLALRYGFDPGKYKNDMAVIHTVLKRLMDRGLVEPATKQGKQAFISRAITRGTPKR